jgi:hypothetical protein
MVKNTMLGAAVWAVAFILSAIVLRGNPLGNWIKGALLVG